MANNREAGNRNQEQNEVKNNQGNSGMNFKQPIQDFVESRMNGNLNHFDTLKPTENWDDLMSFLRSDDRFDAEFIQKFQSGRNDKYQNVLNTTILTLTQSALALLDSVNKLYLGEYDLDNTQKAKLVTSLNSQKITDLRYLMYSQTGRKKLLISEKIVTKDQANSLLKEDSSIDTTLKSIFGNIPTEVTNNPEILDVLKRFIESARIDTDGLSALFGVLKASDTQKLIHYFFPVISLQDLVSLQIYSQEEARSIIETQIGEKLPDAERAEILRNISLKDFFISTSNFSEQNAKMIAESEKMLAKIVKEVDESRIETKSRKIESFEDLKNMVDGSQVIGEKNKKGFQKFSSQSYYVVETKDKEDNITKNHFYVENITDTGITVVNINNINNTLTKDNKGKKEFVSFDNFYKLLEKTSPSESPVQMNFFSKTDFSSYKSQNNFQETSDKEEVSSPEELKSFLDIIDPEGKDVPLEKMCLLVEGGEVDEKEKAKRAISQDIYTISKVENGFIFLDNGEEYSLKDFLQIFEAKKAKRYLNLKTNKDFFDKISKTGDFADIFKNYEFKDGKIIPPDKKNDKKFGGVDYFIGENDVTIHIKKLADGSISFHEGELVTGKTKKDKKGKETKEKDVFTSKRKASGLDYNTFYHYFISKKFKPYYHKEVKTEEDKKAEEFKSKKGFFSTWGGMLSVSQILMGGNQLVEGVKSYFEQGDKLKSAKAALALGKFLPENLRRTLEARVESEQKKSMEEIMDELKGMNSADMVKRIEEIVKTSKADDPQLEAALFTMASKYGNLYNKTSPDFKREDFRWYQALGGKVNDALFLETKAKCEDMANMEQGKDAQPIPFTEEYLVEILLARQTSRKEKDSHYKPKRRNKFEKDFGKMIDQGMGEELEDGEKKTSGEITLKGRISYIMGELTNGGYANAIGGIEAYWGKCGSSYEFNMIPFVLLSTGIPQQLTRQLLKKLIIPPMGRNSPFTTLMMARKGGETELYQNTVREIIKTSDFKNPQDVLKKFNEIGSSPEKAAEFWSEYGIKIDARLSLRDGYIFAKKDENPVFGEFYGYLNGMQSDGEFHLKKEDIQDGRYDFEKYPITLSSGKRHMAEHLKFDPNGIMFDEGRTILMAALKQMHSLKDSDIDREDKKKVFKELFSIIEPAVRARVAAKNKSTDIAMLKRNGIDIDEFKPTEADYIDKQEQIYSYIKSENYQRFLDRKFEEFMSQNSAELSNETVYTIDKVRTSTEDLLSYQKPS